MPRMIWSPSALRDVSRLHDFLAAKDRNAARRAIEAIRSGVKLLERHPEAGRPAAGMLPEFREWPLDYGRSGYVALYRVHQGHVLILAVRHGRELHD